MMVATSPRIDSIEAKSDGITSSGTANSPLHLDRTNERVGVGTTTPGALLDVAAPSGTTKFHVSNVTDSGKVEIESVVGLGGYVNLFQDDNTQSVKLRADGDSYFNGGNVGIGTTSPTSPLTVNGAIRMSFLGLNDNGTGTERGRIGYSNSACYHLLQQSGGTNYFTWINAGLYRLSTSGGHIGSASGTVIGTQTSDERLKSNIVSLDHGLSEVMQLQPIRYEMNGEVEIGFGAQTTQPIIPEAVYDTGDKLDPSDENSAADKLAMDYSRITPVLVKAIQELKAENDALKARLDAAGL